MTAKELLKHQIDDAGYQLAKVIENISDGQFDHKICPSAITPRDTLEHLCEAYSALIAQAAGEKHSWGTFAIADKSSDNVKRTFHDLRERAVAALLASDDDHMLTHGSAFIVAHDYYHIGQLALARIESTPNWDPYSIYRSEG